MKRNLGLALIAIFVLVLTLLLLPTGMAKRNENSVRHSNAKNAPIVPDLFKLNRQQEGSGAPVSLRAVKFAESIPVRDFPAADAKEFSGKVRELEHFEKDDSNEGKYGVEEINEKNREITRHADPNAPRTPDQALSPQTRRNGPTPNPPNPPSVDFEGQSIAETIALGQGFLPPDTNGDVGPNHYVQTVNVTFRIWDKTGAPLTPVAALSTLFAPLGAPCGSSNDGDPIVTYDQLSDRWLISQFCTVATPNNHQVIAISKTGDPTGAYYLYDFMMPNNKFNDYPKFGMWPDAYYMTDNQFNQAGTAFLQGGVFAFDRSKMLVGDPTASFIYFDTAVLFPPGTGINGTDGIGGMLPADAEGYIPPPIGAPCPFVYFQANENAGEPGDQLRIFDFHADFTVPANSTFTERTGSPLPVAAFDPIPIPNTRNVIPQPAPATAGSFVDAIMDRMMFRLSYRNFGTNETLIGNHTVNAATSPAFRAGVRFYELNRTTPTGAFTVAEQQTWAPADTEHRWMGSAANNFQNDVALGFSTSSTTVFPSVRYAARLGTDTPGTGLAQGETIIEAGGGSQTSTSGRWGDYSDLTVDPTDDCSFWYTQEYYTVSSEPGNTTAPWHTRISKFAPGPCAVSPRGTISGTITNCQTGLPIPNAFVSISGGYSRATGAAGTYSAIVTPGTYNASATGTGYDTASTSGLVVADGGNVTFNACLNGNLKQPVADTASITADSCNSNGAIDPNETVTVSLGVKNTGTLNTVNLVGTLQATGGVTSPSGPQTYGVVVAGGATVFKSFTFTAGNLACGAPVVISLQLQDGATDLGTVTYNFNTGVISVSNYSTGDIAVPIPDSPAPAINIPITVADVMTLSDVNVSFRINHTFDGDLQISLVHPDNTVIPLVTNRGSSGANFGTGPNNCSGVPTLIDDQAATAISAGAAPFTASSYRPESPLSALNGKPSNGTWNLRIQDTAALDTGTVGCIKLELNKRSVCCGALINASPPPVITAESISPANNAADPEETVTVDLSLTNVGGNNTTNLVATLQPTGGVSGPSGPQTYGVVVSAGPAVTRPFTFTAQGTCGNNITLTLALQDGATNLGTVTFTMQLGTTSAGAPVSFSNATSVTIPATGTGATTGAPATPYPSNITVSGLTGTILKVTVNLNGLNHTFPSDVDMLLVGPGGQKFIILSDVIGGTDWVNINYTLDDAAAGLVPSSGAPASGTFKPTNYTAAQDPFPVPAPAGPYETPGNQGTATFASVFNGTNPNGTWSLYVVDDASADIGTMSGGWAINITTAQPVCNTQSCTINAPTSITIPPGTCGTIVNYVPAVTFTGACGAVVVDPPSGSFFGIGTRTVLVRGTRADASFTDASFPVTVQDSETQATGLGANVTNNFCNTTVNYTAVGGAGSTTVTDAPAQTLPAPYVHCASCPELLITTTATFTAPVTTCITMPASTDFNTFSRLKILHGEPGLVNRTISGNFTTKTICARTNTVSPFVVALDANAPTAAPAFISGTVTTPDGAPLAGVTMNLSGARSAKVITDSNGNYRFNNVDTDNFYTVTPSLINYHFGPESQSFSLVANKTDAVFTAARDAVISGNAIDTPDYFVRQHYVDFLGREPDEGGFNFWSDQILSCGADAACIERRTINVSAAYFLSIEFQETGGLVDGLYRASYNRRPLYDEFMPDTRTVAQNVIVGTSDWARQLEANKQAFVAAWVQRPAFQSAYGGLSNEGYVDALISHTGVSFSQGERDKLVSGLNNSSATRADVLRQIAENDRFVSAKRNATFVMMEYFGYLRRDPDESGYQFWLNKLNQFGGNFEQAEMVKAFLVSGEYRQRFRL